MNMANMTKNKAKLTPIISYNFYNFIRQQDGSLKSADGSLTGKYVGTDFVVTDTVKGGSVTLNKDFQEGDFGIRPARPGRPYSIHPRHRRRHRPRRHQPHFTGHPGAHQR